MKVVFVKTEWGGFHEPPYTAEENWAFEQRLRRGGDITIIRQRKPDRPELSLEDREQSGRPVIERGT
jgi:hypothetical protein